MYPPRMNLIRKLTNELLSRSGLHTAYPVDELLLDHLRRRHDSSRMGVTQEYVQETRITESPHAVLNSAEPRHRSIHIHQLVAKFSAHAPTVRQEQITLRRITKRSRIAIAGN